MAQCCMFSYLWTLKPKCKDFMSYVWGICLVAGKMFCEGYVCWSFSLNFRVYLKSFCMSLLKGGKRHVLSCCDRYSWIGALFKRACIYNWKWSFLYGSTSATYEALFSHSYLSFTGFYITYINYPSKKHAIGHGCCLFRICTMSCWNSRESRMSSYYSLCGW